ncbi:TonB family protein [Pseudomonas sp. 770NI]|jgi:protein TonB|uniref:energy transducer TonB n=1 Tax=Pseudomonas sp. 770NI TaxID=2528664 RepID=UPI00102323A5|nr:TonB family protein [Pseudomonas sp. 770NI]RZI23628.1 TonB family protein [Pseudomonas sp. 770NI]
MKYCWLSLALLLSACASPHTSEQLAEQHLWEQQLIAHLNLFKFYPANAQAQRLEGEVNMEFTLDAQGNLLRQRVISHSGSELFVTAVQASLPAASPLPAPPVSVLKDGKVEVRAPFVFCLAPSCAEHATHQGALETG